MEFLGVGPLEFLLVILIALLILGPKELEKTAKSIGKGLRKLVSSDTWKTVRDASERVKSLPNELMREAGVDEIKQSLDKNLVQPAKQAQKSIQALDGESWIPDPAEPKPDASTTSPDNENKVDPRTQGQGESK